MRISAIVVATALAALGCGKSDDTKGGSGGSAGDAAADGTSTNCKTDSATSLMDCVDTELLKKDVTFIAKPRAPGTAHWQAVQDLCADRFAKYGFTVERHKYATGVNVIGRKPGTGKPDDQVIVSAHYDSTPGCSGADDNATGVAAVLETARILGPLSFDQTLVVACWDEEEDGLIGAQAYANRAKSQGEKVTVMYSLEMIGYTNDAPNSQTVPAGFDLLFPEEIKKVEGNQFRADFVAQVSIDNAMPSLNAFRAHADAIGLPNVLLTVTPAQALNPLLSDLQRSDHAAFWQAGYPGIMVTDTSNFRYKQYHCAGGEDDISLLDFDFMTKVTKAQLGAEVDVLGLK